MSEALYDYLKTGCLEHGQVRDLRFEVERLCQAWMEAEVDPSPLEMLAEHLARTAQELGPQAKLSWQHLKPQIDYLGLAPQPLEFLQVALKAPQSAAQLAALAIHVLDAAERLALFVYVPELPALQAKSDRSADAARQVGTARFLRG